MYTFSLMRLLLILHVHPQGGSTPLSYAAHKGRLPIIKLLVQSGANMRACDDVSNVNCIHVPMLRVSIHVIVVCYL